MLHRFLLIILNFSFTVIAPKLCHGDDFKYFDTNIDYWKKKKLKDKPIPPVESGDTEVKVQPEFEWNKYLDPKNKEFFREGDYTPPEPFMELVRNPTDQNIKNWFHMIEKKNEMSDRMSERIQEYLVKNSSGIDPQAKDILESERRKIQKTSLEASRYRFRFYFDSSCPHCKRMFSTISDLQRKGFYVEAHQIDRTTEPPAGLSMPIHHADKVDLEKHQVNSVPFMLIGDMQQKVVFRLSGYQSTSDVFTAIESQLRSK